uniref:HTH psq-type domain-containing protein n=1 Tax=Globodera pallida TaxID=36090 RepID=A0A183BYW4_GLOPA
MSAAAKKFARDSQNWNQFPRVVEEVIDEAVSRMNSRKVEEKAKQANMKLAILDMIRVGTMNKKAAEQYGLCAATLGKYCRAAKAKLSECFESDADVETLLKECDGETLTLANLLSMLGQRRISASSVANKSLRSPPNSASSSRKRKSSAIASSQSDVTTVAVYARETAKTPVKQPPPPSDDGVDPTLNAGSSSSFSFDQLNWSAKENAPPLQPLNVETLPRLMTDQQHSQMLLTRRMDPIRFEGTKDELHSLFTEELQQYYQGNVSQLASLMVNYVHYEYALRLRENMFGIPQQLVWAAYNLLARRVQLKNVRFTDVDQEMAEMEMNVGSTFQLPY